MNKLDREKIILYLKEIKAGSTDKIEPLYEILHPAVRYIAMKYLHNEGLADDLVQDFWKDIVDIAKGFRYDKNGFGYICKLMNNRAITRYRKITKERSHIEYVDISALNIEKTNLDSNRISLKLDVENAMNRLTETEKIVIQETYFECKTIRQIAKDLKISKSEIGRIKNSAIQKLQNGLSAYWDK